MAAFTLDKVYQRVCSSFLWGEQNIPVMNMTLQSDQPEARLIITNKRNTQPVQIMYDARDSPVNATNPYLSTVLFVERDITETVKAGQEKMLKSTSGENRERPNRVDEMLLAEPFTKSCFCCCGEFILHNVQGAEKHCKLFGCDNCAIKLMSDSIPLQLGYPMNKRRINCPQCRNHPLKVRKPVFMYMMGLKRGNLRRLDRFENKNMTTREGEYALSVCRCCQTLQETKFVKSACDPQHSRYYLHPAMGFSFTGPHNSLLPIRGVDSNTTARLHGIGTIIRMASEAWIGYGLDKTRQCPLMLNSKIGHGNGEQFQRQLASPVNDASYVHFETTMVTSVFGLHRFIKTTGRPTFNVGLSYDSDYTRRSHFKVLSIQDMVQMDTEASAQRPMKIGSASSRRFNSLWKNCKSGVFKTGFDRDWFMKSNNGEMFSPQQQNSDVDLNTRPVNDTALICGLLGQIGTATEKVLDYYTNSAFTGICESCITQLVQVGQRMDMELASFPNRNQHQHSQQKQSSLVIIKTDDINSECSPFLMKLSKRQQQQQQRGGGEEQQQRVLGKDLPSTALGNTNSTHNRVFDEDGDDELLDVGEFAEAILDMNGRASDTRPDVFRKSYKTRNWDELETLRALVEKQSKIRNKGTFGSDETVENNDVAVFNKRQLVISHPSNIQNGTSQTIVSVFGKLVQVHPEDRVYSVVLVDIIDDLYKKSLGGDAYFEMALSDFLQKIEKLTFVPNTVAQQMGYLKPVFCPACSEPSCGINTRLVPLISDKEKANMLKAKSKRIQRMSGKTCPNTDFDTNPNCSSSSSSSCDSLGTTTTSSRPHELGLALPLLNNHSTQTEEKVSDDQNSKTTVRVAPMIYRSNNSLIKPGVSPLLQSCSWNPMTSIIGLLHCQDCERVVCGACPINRLRNDACDTEMKLKCKPNKQEGRNAVFESILNENDDTDSEVELGHQLSPPAYFNNILCISNIFSRPTNLAGVIETLKHLGERHGIFFKDVDFVLLMCTMCPNLEEAKATNYFYTDSDLVEWRRKHVDRPKMSLTEQFKMNLDTSSIETLRKWRNHANKAQKSSKKLSSGSKCNNNLAWRSLNDFGTFFDNRTVRVFLPPTNYFFDPVQNVIKSNRKLLVKVVDRFMKCVVGDTLLKAVENRFGTLATFINRAAPLNRSRYPLTNDIVHSHAVSHCSSGNMGSMFTHNQITDVESQTSDDRGLIFPNYVYRAKHQHGGGGGERFATSEAEEASRHRVFLASSYGSKRIDVFDDDDDVVADAFVTISNPKTKQNMLRELVVQSGWHTSLDEDDDDDDDDESSSTSNSCRNKRVHPTTSSTTYTYHKGISVGFSNKKPATISVDPPKILQQLTIDNFFQHSKKRHMKKKTEDTDSSSNNSSCISASELDQSEEEDDDDEVVILGEDEETTSTTLFKSNNQLQANIDLDRESNVGLPNVINNDITSDGDGGAVERDDSVSILDDRNITSSPPRKRQRTEPPTTPPMNKKMKMKNDSVPLGVKLTPRKPIHRRGVVFDDDTSSEEEDDDDGGKVMNKRRKRSSRPHKRRRHNEQVSFDVPTH